MKFLLTEILHFIIHQIFPLRLSLPQRRNHARRYIQLFKLFQEYAQSVSNDSLQYYFSLEHLRFDSSIVYSGDSL